ncbi:glycosyltransferase [Pedobacter lithocola]|uniref:Glycosyltransferase n=1 Tax=Pedobacter lithocola TaxID=1908239 RepID=A0ABV8P544_9SPHI
MIELSIIVPVYNKAQYIDVCIESILKQSISDFELILVNDGSTDSSGARCDEFAKRDNRITVIHQVNEGVSSARNAGSKVAKGKYIGFVDADDILYIKMYEVLISNIKKYNADISICGVRRVSPGKIQLFGGNNTIRIYNRDEGITGLFSGEILLSNYDKIYKKETVEEIFFKPTASIFEDAYYNFQALKTANKTVYDDRILYDYMIRDNSLSQAAFSQKYMKALYITKEIVNTCQNELQNHIDEAKAFDFNINMIYLNMILVESTKTHYHEYSIIKENLLSYHNFYKENQYVSKRYKYGYTLFRFSPLLYASILKIYSTLTNSEHINRKKKLSQ